MIGVSEKKYFEKLKSWLYPIAWDLLWLEGGEEEEVINVLSRKVSRLFCNKSLERGGGDSASG